MQLPPIFTALATSLLLFAACNTKDDSTDATPAASGASQPDLSANVQNSDGAEANSDEGLIRTILALASGEDQQAAAGARQALRMILADDEWDVATLYNHWGQSEPIPDRLHLALGEGRVVTIDWLRRPDRKAAVKPLLAALQGKGLHPSEAARYLGWLGRDAKAALPALTALALAEASEHPNHEEIRSNAATALFYIGPETKESTEALLEVKRTDAERYGFFFPQSATLPAIVQASPAASEAVVAYCVDHLNGPGGLGYVFGLGEIGPSAKAAVPALVKTLGDLGPEDKHVAATALCRIATPQKEWLLVILDRMKVDARESWGNRSRLEHLCQLGPDAKEIVPEIIASLELLNIHGAEVLAAIGSDAKEAIPELFNRWKAQDYHGPLDAYVQAIVKIGAIPDETVSTLLTDLENPELRMSVALMLGTAGSRKDLAIPVLLDYVRGDDNQKRALAAIALSQVDPRHEAVIPALLSALKDESPLGPEPVLAALRQLGPIAKSSVPALCEAMKSLPDYSDFHRRREAMNLAAELGANPDLVADSLAKVFQENSEWAPKEAAIGALVILGRQHAEAVHALVDCIPGKDDAPKSMPIDAVDLMPINALADIGPPAKDAVPALVELTKRGDWTTVRAAVRALKKIDPDALQHAKAL